MSVTEIICSLTWLYENPHDLHPETIGHEAIRQAVICLSKTINERLASIFHLPVFPPPAYVACDHSFNGFPCCECSRYVNPCTIKGEEHGFLWAEIVKHFSGKSLDDFTILRLAWQKGLVTGFQYFDYLNDLEKREAEREHNNETDNRSSL
jgi:hypothetical protein